MLLWAAASLACPCNPLVQTGRWVVHCCTAFSHHHQHSFRLFTRWNRWTWLPLAGQIMRVPNWLQTIFPSQTELGHENNACSSQSYHYAQIKPGRIIFAFKKLSESEIPIYRSPRELLTSDCSSRLCKKQKGNLRERERRCQSLVYNHRVSDNREKSLKPYVTRCLLPLFLWKMLKTHPTETESDTRSHFIRLLANLYFVKHDTCWPKHSVWIRFWQFPIHNLFYIRCQGKSTNSINQRSTAGSTGVLLICGNWESGPSLQQ